MFRPMRRTKRQLSDADAKELLLREKRGIFAVNGDDGYPFAVPVNYFYERGAGKSTSTGPNPATKSTP